MNRLPLYIETKIKCDLDTLWINTQNPLIHQEWDLRFSEIEYLAKENPKESQRFSYSTRIGFGIEVKGIGESVATKTKENGESTSVLRFSSESRLSIIKQGSGYWKYVPEADGIKFYTGYDYETRWGLSGKIIDKYIFRPLMVWATAWSFDRLKNWIEKGIHPKQAVKSQLTIFFANLVLGLVWIYQGLVPKLLFTDTGEIEILERSGLLAGHEKNFLTGIGVAEIIFGLAFFFIYNKSIHILNVTGILFLSLAALLSHPVIYTFPFNPFSLNLAMVTLSIISILNLEDLPKASNCITKRK